MRHILPILILAASIAAGCVASREVGEPPKRTSYEAWGAKLGEVPQIIRSEELVAAALVHYRRANQLDKRKDIVDGIDMAISLFGQAADKIFEAWELYPEYEKFIIMELDKVYGYIHKCVAMKPYYFDPTDPLNVYGGALTYEQRRRMSQYRQSLERWERASGQ